MPVLKEKIYLVIEPIFSAYSSTQARTIKVVKMTKTKPADASGLVLEVEVEIPSEVFDIPKLKLSLTTEELAQVKATQTLAQWVNE